MVYPMNPPDPTAVVGRRIVAFLIDLALVTVVTMAILFFPVSDALVTAPEGTVDCSSSTSSALLEDVDDTTREEPTFCFSTGDGDVQYLPVSEESRISTLLYGIALTTGFLNSVLVQSLAGASLGKLALGLRVIRKDGRRANVGWNLLRWVLLMAGVLLCCLGWIIDLVMVFATKGHRRVGDYAAGTFVVGKDAMGTPPQIPGVTAPTAGYPVATPYPGQPGTSPPLGTPGDGSAGQPGWAPPAEQPQAPPVAPPPSPPAQPSPGVDGPTWDEARDAYIQYDPELGEWVQWDAQQNQWRPIDR